MKYYSILLLCFFTATSNNCFATSENHSEVISEASSKTKTKVKARSSEIEETSSSISEESSVSNVATDHMIRHNVDYKKRSETLTILSIILGFVSTVSAILVVRTVGSMQTKP